MLAYLVITLHARFGCPCITLAYHRKSSSDLSFFCQQHQLQLHLCHFQQWDPGNLRQCDVLCPLKSVNSVKHFSENLKNFLQMLHVCLQINAMVVSHCLAAKRLRNGLHSPLLFVCYVLSYQLPWKCLLGCQQRFIRVHSLCLTKTTIIQTFSFGKATRSKQRSFCDFDFKALMCQKTLKTVPTIVNAHMFCVSRDTRISFGCCLLIQGYFCAVQNCAEKA